MKIGTVKEIKNHEYRVGLTPYCVKSYVSHGHQIFVEKDAGVNSGFENEDYISAGAAILDSAKEVFDISEMIVKVKEPLPEEYDKLRDGQILYTYLHLAAAKELTKMLMDKKVKAVAFETIEDEKGNLPCLRPMSEIAGRLSIQEGAKYLEKPSGGRGILLGGVPGIKRGKVAIIGAGVAGSNACKMAVGLGADVTVLDINSEKLTYLDDIYGSCITTLYSNESNIDNVVQESDLVIGTILLTGASAPKLLTKKHLKNMKKGAVIVDVSIDQGGFAETSKPTTHANPVFTVDGVVHYCVANMPGAVSLSSTLALTSATLRYGLLIADNGLEKACELSDGVKSGVNVYKGNCVYESVALSLGLDYTELDSILK